MKIKLNPYRYPTALLVAVMFSSCVSNETTTQQDQNYLRGELPVQEGMVVFNQNCASCHNFNATEIGPSLAGITSVKDKDWIKRFIQNSQKNDSRGGRKGFGSI